jgi:uroporphyrinogen-III decarboxylase
MRQRLHVHARTHRLSESAVVQEALAKYLDDTYDGELLIRRMDGLGHDVARILRDVNVAADAFGIFVQFWFAHTPKLGDEQKSSAERSALERYKRFVDHAAAKVASGTPLLRQLAPDGGSGVRATSSKAEPTKVGGS